MRAVDGDGAAGRSFVGLRSADLGVVAATFISRIDKGRASGVRAGESRDERTAAWPALRPPSHDGVATAGGVCKRSRAVGGGGACLALAHRQRVMHSLRKSKSNSNSSRSIAISDEPLFSSS